MYICCSLIHYLLCISFSNPRHQIKSDSSYNREKPDREYTLESVGSGIKIVRIHVKEFEIIVDGSLDSYYRPQPRQHLSSVMKITIKLDISASFDPVELRVSKLILFNKPVSAEIKKHWTHLYDTEISPGSAKRKLSRPPQIGTY